MKQDIEKEKAFLMNGMNHKVPPGIVRLDHQDRDISKMMQKD